MLVNKTENWKCCTSVQTLVPLCDDQTPNKLAKCKNDIWWLFELYSQLAFFFPIIKQSIYFIKLINKEIKEQFELMDSLLH